MAALLGSSCCVVGMWENEARAKSVVRSCEFSFRNQRTFSSGTRMKLACQLRGTQVSHSSTPASPRPKPRVALFSPQASIEKVSAQRLDEILTNERTRPMIIDFYATWCGPCILLAQELEMLAVEFGQDVRFLKVDTDEEHELASQMEIRGLPTMVFVGTDPSKLAIRTEGLLPSDVIRNIIEKELMIPTPSSVPSP